VNAPHPLVAQLTHVREQRGLSRRAANRAARLGTARVDGWEQGRCAPTVAGLEQYAASLGYRLALVPDGHQVVTLPDLDAESVPVAPAPVEYEPITAERAAENRRVLAAALGITDDMPVRGDAA
jgi:transcriptional regulator with XRE-family HTH domain